MRDDYEDDDDEPLDPLIYLPPFVDGPPDAARDVWEFEAAWTAFRQGRAGGGLWDDERRPAPVRRLRVPSTPPRADRAGVRHQIALPLPGVVVPTRGRKRVPDAH